MKTWKSEVIPESSLESVFFFSFCFVCLRTGPPLNAHAMVNKILQQNKTAFTWWLLRV